MKLWRLASLCLPLLLVACARHGAQPELAPKAYGTAITEASGGKQIAGVGETVPQPVVVQVNDADGNPVAGAFVSFRGEELAFNPAQGLTDSSGQVTTAVQLGPSPRQYQIVVETLKKDGSRASLTLEETAIGFEQKVGKAVNDKYCIRCHDSESTPERVSNLDNLSTAPHQFSDGAALNGIPDSDLSNIITHGGAALGKSPQMPAYGMTLTPAEIKAVIAYMRSVADPPYQAPGVKYAKE